jgi:hypothetical protein
MKQTIYAIGACLLLAACSANFDHLEFETTEPPVSGVELGPSRVTMPLGASVVVRARAVDLHGNDLKCDVGLRSRDPNILRVERATSGPTVFTGVSHGDASVIVFCDGEDVGSVAGTVTDDTP